MRFLFCILALCLCCFGKIQSQSLSRQLLETAEIHFDFGRHELRPEGDSLLLTLVGKAKGKEGILIKITAHTDSIGSVENNRALSERRAKSILDFLVGKGIEAGAISLDFFGEAVPASGNNSEEGRQRNRRATVEVFRQAPAVVVQGVVVDEKTGLPIPQATVVIRYKGGRDSLLTDETGSFKTSLPKGTVAGIDVSAKCHFLKTDMLKATTGLAPLNLALRPTLSGEKMDIENLYFVGNLPVPLEKSKPELAKILRFLQLSPNLKVEIAGHVNFPNKPPVVKESAEYQLSQNRAKLVYDYLLNGGIAADRISYKGYGNWEMRYPFAIAESEQALNRRVEIRVLEGGCE